MFFFAASPSAAPKLSPTPPSPPSRSPPPCDLRRRVDVDAPDPSRSRASCMYDPSLSRMCMLLSKASTCCMLPILSSPATVESSAGLDPCPFLARALLWPFLFALRTSESRTRWPLQHAQTP